MRRQANQARTGDRLGDRGTDQRSSGGSREQKDETVERRKLVNVALVGALLFGPAALPACDNEDQKDAEEIGNDIEKGAEDAVNDAEKEIDEADKDGKDDN